MILQAKQFGVTITTSLDLYECYNHDGVGSNNSLSESHINIYTNIDKQKMTHAIYNILSHAIRSSAAGSQGHGNISVSMSLKSTSTSSNFISNDTLVIIKVSYANYDRDLVGF